MSQNDNPFELDGIKLFELLTVCQPNPKVNLYFNTERVLLSFKFLDICPRSKRPNYLQLAFSNAEIGEPKYIAQITQDPDILEAQKHAITSWEADCDRRDEFNSNFGRTWWAPGVVHPAKDPPMPEVDGYRESVLDEIPIIFHDTKPLFSILLDYMKDFLALRSTIQEHRKLKFLQLEGVDPTQVSSLSSTPQLDEMEKQFLNLLTDCRSNIEITSNLESGVRVKLGFDRSLSKEDREKYLTLEFPKTTIGDFEYESRMTNDVEIIRGFTLLHATQCESITSSNDTSVSEHNPVMTDPYEFGYLKKFLVGFTIHFTSRSNFLRLLFKYVANFIQLRQQFNSLVID